MKNLIKISVLCLITGLLFSSCNHRILIAKRHYNNGYYFSFVKGQKTPHLKMSDEKILSPEVEDKILYVSEESDIEKIPNKIETENKTEKVIQKEIKVKEPLKNIAAKFKDIKSRVIVSPFFQNSNLASITNKQLNDSKSSEELSTLWIVIVVILVLWAIGFLSGGFGLGGLINLLLLIALILFILWLLRVV